MDSVEEFVRQSSPKPDVEKKEPKEKRKGSFIDRLFDKGFESFARMSGDLPSKRRADPSNIRFVSSFDYPNQ